MNENPENDESLLGEETHDCFHPQQRRGAGGVCVWRGGDDTVAIDRVRRTN